MWRVRLVFVAMTAGLLTLPATSFAQSQPAPLSSVLQNLYLDALGSELNALKTVFGGQIPVDQFLNNALDRLQIADHIIQLAGAQLSSFPVGSSSGGFSWSFDSASGTFVRASNSFGPVFAERALTIGRKRLNVGVNYQHITFDHLDGLSLSGGEIVGYNGVPNVIGNVGFFFADALDLHLTTDIVNTFATYGVSDSLDVGVAVPFNSVKMNASLTSRVGDTQTGIATDIAPVVFSTSGSASGIGDIVLRAKYHMLKQKGGGLAETIDVRLPTGDEANLLGAAGPQVKLLLIYSSTIGRVGPHANFGYTISGKSSSVDNPDLDLAPPSEEINYTGGADVAVSSRLTAAFDVIGRTLRGAGTVSQVPSVFGSQFQELQFNAGNNLNLLLGAAGARFNPWGNMLVTANVLFPLSQNGLTDKLTWMLGVDYSF
jgi:hypothetical protein